MVGAFYVVGVYGFSVIILIDIVGINFVIFDCLFLCVFFKFVVDFFNGIFFLFKLNIF